MSEPQAHVRSRRCGRPCLLQRVVPAPQSWGRKFPLSPTCAPLRTPRLWYPPHLQSSHSTVASGHRPVPGRGNQVGIYVVFINWGTMINRKLHFGSVRRAAQVLRGLPRSLCHPADGQQPSRNGLAARKTRERAPSAPIIRGLCPCFVVAAHMHPIWWPHSRSNGPFCPIASIRSLDALCAAHHPARCSRSATYRFVVLDDRGARTNK